MYRHQIRIGLIIDSGYIPDWVCQIINEINQSNNASIEAVIISSNTEKLNFELTKKPYRKNILYSLYCRLENRRWSGVTDTYAGTTNCEMVYNGKDYINISVENPEMIDLQRLRASNLDLFINFSCSNVSDQIIRCVKSGLWSLCYGYGGKYYQKAPIGFWESYDNSPTMECMLISTHNDFDNDKVLYQISYATNEYRSALMNRNQAFQHSARIIPKKLNELYELGTETFHTALTKAKTIDNSQINNDRIREPNNTEMLKFFIERVQNSVKMRLLYSLFNLQWTLKYRIGKGISRDFTQYKKLVPTRGGWWADPFIVYHEDTYHLFFEDALYDKNNADISVISIKQDGTASDPRPCLVRPYHLSYPFVFFWEGHYYMIPESKSNKTIEIYKATRFPDEWEFHGNLMENIEAVDTTLYFHNNKWWLFTNIMQQRNFSIDNELSIFYADSPLGNDWIPHAMNPVISDVRRARPAGRIYEHEGKIIRPSQDGSVRYGYGIRLNEIITLTETEYQEREIEFIEPSWRKMLWGTHTIAHTGDLTVIDVLEWRPRFLQKT